jgi:hypothetical protein
MELDSINTPSPCPTGYHNTENLIRLVWPGRTIIASALGSMLDLRDLREACCFLIPNSISRGALYSGKMPGRSVDSRKPEIVSCITSITIGSDVSAAGPVTLS